MTVAKSTVEVPRAPTESRRPLRHRLRSLRDASFGPASERPFQRRLVDGIRVVLATGALTYLALNANTVPRGELGLFTYFNSLPSGLLPVFRTISAAGTLWALGLVVVAALVGRRWRLALAMLLSGAGGWASARVVGQIVVRDESLARSLHVITRLSGTTPHFPQVRIALVAAILAAAAPYLSRPTRILGGVLLVGVALAPMYFGNAYPRDVLGGAVLGWGCAAVIALVFGSPGGRPTTRQVAASLAQLGVHARDLRLTSDQPFGSTEMVARDTEGRLGIRVLGRDTTDTQLLAKLLRGVLYKEAGPPLTATRLHQLQLQALAMLLARSNTARVARVLVVGKAGPGAALLVEREFEGRKLASFDHHEITDELLDATWHQVTLIHEARVVHGRLNADHVVVTTDGPAIIGFERATLTASEHHRAGDVAELLAATSALVGSDRAVDSCTRTLGEEALAGALPLLQPEALDRDTRRSLHVSRRELNHRLTALRERGARAGGIEPPELLQLHRIRATNLLLAVGTLVALFGLLSQVGGDPEPLWDAMTSAQWSWLAASFALSMATNIPYAIALMGSVPTKLPLWPATECQVAMSFSNLAVPAVGGYAVQVRFLQKEGNDLASAVAAGGVVNTVAGTVVQIGLLALALAVTPDRVSLHFPAIDTSLVVQYVLGTIFVVGVAAGIVFAVRRFRDWALPPLVRAAGTVWRVVRSPQRLTLLVVGNVGALVLYACVLQADLIAFDTHVSFWTLLALSIALGTLAALVPIAGGGTAVSTVGMTGALTALHVPAATAAGAVLLNQLVVTYLPAAPGWLATRDMLRRDLL